MIRFDIDRTKIAELQRGLDRTGEVSPGDLKAADFIIVAVPLPINEALQPDLTALKKASNLIGANLSPER